MHFILQMDGWRCLFKYEHAQNPKVVFELMSIHVIISGSSVYNLRFVRLMLVASSGVGVRCGGAQSDSTFFCLLPSEAL